MVQDNIRGSELTFSTSLSTDQSDPDIGTGHRFLFLSLEVQLPKKGVRVYIANNYTYGIMTARAVI